MPNLETYKARWQDFLTECANLDHSRAMLARGYLNEDLDATADDCWERVWRFENRIAHLSVFERAERMRGEAYRYADM
jgi:hypothetical protein